MSCQFQVPSKVIQLYCCSVAQLYPTLCNPMNCSMPGFPVLHCLPEFAQTFVHWIGNAIQPITSIIPLSSCPQSFPTSWSFPMSWGLLLRLPWRTWVWPFLRPGVEVVQLLGSQGLWQHQVLRGVGGQDSRKYSALGGHGNQQGPIRCSILAWRTSSLTEKPGWPQSTGSQRVGQD